ncbi:SDR family oxidoreductase [Paenibacillus endoradicis]|uniref:SDR family oxidoreductase n=1 Tax=Paenibacillus endoradicis TaxID=2972487 RepID=UPI002158DF9C|nr:SDR family oxidoreductase [Paenibacillus endoradicis]MCR8660614.1 SDR family oxidoreductase [Paenibacillus endoradicis]
MKNLLNYEGKKVVVTGAASGMGEATAKILLEQGAEVYALDINDSKLDVKKSIKVNLGDKASIDEAVSQLPDVIDSVFSCAGIAGTIYGSGRFTPADVVTINFIGGRYLIESIIPRMPEGSSIATVASLAGMGWMQKLNVLMPLIKTSTFEDAKQWVDENITDPNVMDQDETKNGSYGLSKEALIAWVKYRAYSLAEKKIRLNNVSPSSTITPMLADFNDIAKADVTSSFISPIGRAAVAEDQANALVFINSDLNTYISGQDLQVDYAVTSKLFFGE